jgi:hypothetical protein
MITCLSTYDATGKTKYNLDLVIDGEVTSFSRNSASELVEDLLSTESSQGIPPTPEAPQSLEILWGRYSGKSVVPVFTPDKDKAEIRDAFKEKGVLIGDFKPSQSSTPSPS